MGRMTLWGMQQIQPTLLEGVNLPEGLDRGTFTQLLNMECGSSYPHIQVPPILEILIGQFFQARQSDFRKMYDALSVNYSPIENYDRTEERKLDTQHSGTDTLTDSLGTSLTVTREGTETNKTTGTDTTSTSGKETMTHTGTESTHSNGKETTTRTGTEGDELKVSAYDAEGYTPREERTRTPDLTDVRAPDLSETRTPDLTDVRTPDLSETRTPDLTQTRTPNLTDISTNAGKDTHSTDYGHKEEVVEKLHAHGNIGVTTNQLMIESEMVLRQKYNIYETIIRMFEREFLSRVY